MKIVITSHDKLGNAGRKTGFWLEELAAPYFTFKADASHPSARSRLGLGDEFDADRMEDLSARQSTSRK
jgi:hypothetical protein